MVVKVPEKAFILAAGFGSRLRPYTDNCPKPMVKVGGRSLIYRALDHLRDAGVKDVVVNMHYMADTLREHLEQYLLEFGAKIHFTYSYEDPILDTGGGVKAVLDHFEDLPFFVVAGDGLWRDTGENAFHILAREWDDSRMDILTFMQPVDRMILTQGTGDYDVFSDGHVVRSLNKTGNCMWTNIRLNHPRIYQDSGSGAFSFLPLMDRAQQDKRLFGLLQPGEWHHISTPSDLERADKEFTAHGW